MVKVKINVTKKDIKGGVCGNGNACPVALAMHRVGLSNVDVWGREVRIPNLSSRFPLDDAFSVKLNNAVKKFVAEFDTSAMADPFSFILRLPNKIAAQLKIRKRYIVA